MNKKKRKFKIWLSPCYWPTPREYNMLQRHSNISDSNISDSNISEPNMLQRHS